MKRIFDLKKIESQWIPKGKDPNADLAGQYGENYGGIPNAKTDGFERIRQYEGKEALMVVFKSTYDGSPREYLEHVFEGNESPQDKQIIYQQTQKAYPGESLKIRPLNAMEDRELIWAYEEEAEKFAREESQEGMMDQSQTMNEDFGDRPEDTRFASKKIFDLNKIAGSYTLPNLDTDRYPNREREGLEGPTRLQSGKVVYYDRREGKYYDPSVDMYLETDDYEAHAGMRPPGYRNNGPTPPPGGTGAGAPTT